ncbi:hypothetical protein NDN08_005540 [Rhodosorus marinus]|uniref:Uncharacterized protein n=1 Tax=Rhodosorus marinus TaxID=101924 RepID=A0AAV8V3Z8_9RHOD|nr:hypothetical protein NDN08_005540 [Rhodosorus marinus]
MREIFAWLKPDRGTESFALKLIVYAREYDQYNFGLGRNGLGDFLLLSLVLEKLIQLLAGCALDQPELPQQESKISVIVELLSKDIYSDAILRDLENVVFQPRLQLLVPGESIPEGLYQRVCDKVLNSVLDTLTSDCVVKLQAKRTRAMGESTSNRLDDCAVLS